MLKKTVVTITTGAMNLTMANRNKIIVRKNHKKTCASSHVIKNMNLRTAGAIQNPRTIVESILRMLGRKQTQRKNLNKTKRRKTVKPKTMKMQ